MAPHDVGKHKICRRAWSVHLLAPLALLAAVLLTETGRPQQASDDLPEKPILRIETGKHGAQINRIDTDAANRFAVTASWDKTVRVWALPDGRLLRTLWLPLDLGNVGKAHAVAISPDGSTVAVGGYSDAGAPSNNNIFLFDRASGELTKRLSGLPGAALHLAYSANGERLVASLEGNNGIQLFDVGHGYRWLQSDRQYRESSYWAAFDQAGRLVTTSDDGHVRLYAANDYRQPISVAGSKGVPYAAAFSPDGTRVAVGCWDVHHVVVLSSSDLTQQLFEADTAGDTPDVGDVGLGAVGWSQDGHFLFAGGTWSVNGVSLVRRWSDGGKGPFVDIQAIPLRSSSPIMEIVGLNSGSMLFAHTDGFGLINPEATKANQLQGLGGLDLQSKEGLDLRVSADGGAVQIDSLEPRHTYRFVLKDRRVDIDPLPDGTLLAPITQVPGLDVTEWRYNTTPLLNGARIKLEPDERALSLAITPDKHNFVLGADYKVRLFDQLGHEVWPVARRITGDYAFHVNVTGNNRLLVVACGDSTIRWLRLSDGEELLALFIHPDGKRWIAWTPQGYYDASVGGDELIGWHINHGYDQAPDFHKVSQFRDEFNRPDIVALVLDTLDVDEAIHQANAASGRKAPAAIAESLPPDVDILSPVDGWPAAESPIVVTYHVSSSMPVTEITVKVDGRPPVPPPKKLGSNSDGTSASLSIEIPPNDALISLFAKNEKGQTGSSHVHIKWSGAPDWYKPNLFVLAVGVSHYKNKKLNLNFPHKDAKDFVSVMREQRGRFYRDVFPRLASDHASREQIREGLNWLQNRTNKRDFAMLFLSGHGEPDSHGHFHFLPSNADLSHFNLTTITAEEIRLILSDIPGRVIVFVDSCFSGRLNPKGSTKSDVNRLATDFLSDGIIVFTSSDGNEVSQEQRKWQNGAFTKALVEAFEGGIKQNKISVTVLEDYLERRVKELTHGQQNPRLGRPDTIENYDNYVIATVIP